MHLDGWGEGACLVRMVKSGRCHQDPGSKPDSDTYSRGLGHVAYLPCLNGRFLVSYMETSGNPSLHFTPDEGCQI